MVGQSTVHFLGVPFDSSYRNVLDLGSEQANYDFLMTKVRYSFSNYSFLVKDKTMRVRANKNDIDTCNYVIWNNGTKRFYGFIIDTKYCNPETTEVTIEVDAFATYWYDNPIKTSFIEREHVSDDVKGNYTLDEHLPLGEYKYFAIDVDMDILTDYYYLLGVLYDNKFNPASGDIYCGIPCGYEYFVCHKFADALLMVENIVGNKGEEALQFAVMIPKLAVSHMSSEALKSISQVTGKSNANTYSFTIDIDTNSIDGYVPKNKKCLIYPYQSLYASNNEGQSNEYLYEHFTNYIIGFRMYCNLSANVEVVMTPQAYKGSNIMVDQGLSISNYPQIGFNTDTYHYWLACNVPSLGFNVASNVVAGAVSKPAYGITGAVDNIASFASQAYQHSISPMKAIGNTVCSANASAELKKFSFFKKCVTRQYIEAIDNYFEMYGYRVDRIGRPNFNTRPHWNYVKLRDAIWETRCPSPYREKLLRAFNTTGVTLWHNSDFQYGSDNH